MTFFEMLGLLIFAHALADYPLQGDFLAKAKDHTRPIPGVPWRCAMAAHCVIHAGAVGLITGSMWFAVAEFVLHWIIDWVKCLAPADETDDERADSFVTDQAMHLACKVGYVLALWAIGGAA